MMRVLFIGAVVVSRRNEIGDRDTLGVGLYAFRIAQPGKVTQVGHLLANVPCQFDEQMQRLGRKKCICIKDQVNEVIIAKEFVQRVDPLQSRVALGEPDFVGVVKSELRYLPQEEGGQGHEQTGECGPPTENQVGQTAKNNRGSGHIHL